MSHTHAVTVSVLLPDGFPIEVSAEIEVYHGRIFVRRMRLADKDLEKSGSEEVKSCCYDAVVDYVLTHSAEFRDKGVEELAGRR